MRLLDDAMMRLRRVWTPPPASVNTKVPDHEHSTVELSTVLVVEACARAAAASRNATVADVAAFAAVAPSTGSRFVRRAAGAGMVERSPARADGRRTEVRLTEDGWALYTRARDFRLQRLTITVADWNPDEVATFVALLSRFASDATDPGRGAPLVPG